MKKIFLVLLFCLFLIGCSKKEAYEIVNKDAVYSSEYVDFELSEDNTVYDCCLFNDGIYIAYHKFVGDEVTTGIGLTDLGGRIRCNFDIKEIEGNDDFSIDLIYGGNEGCVAEVDVRETFIDGHGEEVTSEKLLLVKFDNGGNPVKVVRPEEDFKIDYIYECIALDNDRILFFDGRDVVITDSDLNLLVEKISTDYSHFIGSRQGEIFAVRYADDKEICDILNLDKSGKLVKIFSGELLAAQHDFFSGGLGADAAFLDENMMYAFDFESKEQSLICDLDYSGIYFKGFVKDFAFLNENQFFITMEDYMSGEIILLKCDKVSPENVKKKKVLTVGCFGSDEIELKVAEFNRASDEFRLKICDYNEYSSEKNPAGNAEKLEKDLMSGNGPDILACKRFPSPDNMFEVSKFIEKGVFEPLDKYIERDSDVEADDIFPGLLNACSYEDKIYALCPGFVIHTYVGKKGLFAQNELSLEKLMQIVDEKCEGREIIWDLSRYEILEKCLSYEPNPFYSREENSCYFDTPEFSKILEMLYSVSERNDFGDDYEEYYNHMVKAFENNDSVMAYEDNLCDYTDLLYYEMCFNDTPTLMGLPDNIKSSGCIELEDNIFLILKSSENREGAWGFVKMMLLPEYQREVKWAIPASIKEYDKRTESMLRADKAYIWFAGRTMEVENKGEEYAKELKQFILDSDKYFVDQYQMHNIVFEEAQYYFEGKRSLEDTVKIIQSRASLLMEEGR